MPPSSSAWNLMPNRIAILALITLFAPGCAFAMDRTNARSQSDVGLDLGLHWGMTAAAVKQLFPALAAAPDSGRPIGEQADDPKLARVETVVTAYAGCSLNITLMFFRDYLDHVAIVTENAAACHQKIEDRLIRSYREPNRPASCPNIIHRSWKDAAQTMTYDYDCSAPNNRLNIQFHQDGDSSGRVADRKRFEACQRIGIEFLPPAADDGASNPQVDTDLAELGCSGAYPSISFRLQEQGSVPLDIDILADGTVGDVQLAKSNGKPRLDNAAVALVRQKLKFLPAMKDGTPVEARRQVAITFTILHFIHGPAMLVAHCPDRLVINGPCQLPVAAMTLAPARNSRPLRVSSSEIVPDVALPEASLNARKSPALRWSGGPASTASYVLVAEDIAPHTTSSAPCVYWIIYDIPGSARTLPPGEPPDTRLVRPTGAMSIRKVGGLGCFRDPYAGPTRSVHYEVFALDKKLGLDPASSDRMAIIERMKDHVLSSGEIVATYSPN
jgi:TonB family protein